MGDAWDAFSFIETDRGKQGSCGHKKDPLPLSLLDPRKDIAAEHRSRAAAAASSCVGVLRRIVIDQDTAVFMNGRKPDILFLQKIQENFLPDDPQIPGKDGIIILGSLTSK